MPSDHYLLGILAPRGTVTADPQRIDDDAVDADDSRAESAAAPPWSPHRCSIRRRPA